jgi:hypothetical protein
MASTFSRKLFADPETLHPRVHAEAITKDVAERFGDLAKLLVLNLERAGKEEGKENGGKGR